jgi:hypothetical protein
MAKSFVPYMIETMKFPSAQKYITPDDRWDVINEIKSHHEFIETMVPLIRLNEKAPQDVKDIFEEVNYLHVFGYYKFQFFDVAYQRALNAMELAFKLKYEEIAGQLRGKKSLHELIEFLASNNLFDTHVTQIHKIRKLRNYQTHQERYGYSGNTFVMRIHHVTQVINELYEDINLRLQRKALTDQFFSFNGGQEYFEGVELIRNTKVSLLYHLQILMIDNKEPLPVYHLMAIPVFRFSVYTKDGNGGPAPRMFRLALVNVSVNNNEIYGFEVLSKSPTIIRKISTQQRIGKYNTWKMEFDIFNKYKMLDLSWQHNAGMLYFDTLQYVTNKTVR